MFYFILNFSQISVVLILDNNNNPDLQYFGSTLYIFSYMCHPSNEN